MNNMGSATFFNLVRDYLAVYLPKVRLCSEATVVSYRTTLNQLLDYMKQSKNTEICSIDFDDFDAHAITGFVGWLVTEFSVTPSTCNQKLAALKAFFAYCAMRDPSLTPLHRQIAQIKRQRSKAQHPEIMSEKAYQAILSQIDTETCLGRRNHFILVMLFETGLRIGELLNITCGDIVQTSTGGTVTVIGKGGKSRTVVYGNHFAKYLAVYLNEFHEQPCELKTPLIYTIHRGEKTVMSSDTPQRFIQNYANKAKEVCPEVPKSVHPHSFRHLRASTLYRQGIPLSIIARLLGHVSINTTAVYAVADIETLRKAVERGFPDYQSLPDSLLPEQSEEIIRKISGLK